MELVMMKAPIRILIAAFLYLIAVPSFAQDSQSVPASASGPGLLSGPQVEALVSPIALYPDSLLSNVLMASTYPLEIVQAERWLTRNKNLSSEALKAAVDKQPWDDSVKALIATSPALAMMSSEVDWTQKLGDAVLAQQADVMSAIQRLRLKAYDNGKLTTNPEQKVTVEQQVPGQNATGEQQADNHQTVVIEQANDDTVYVPAYDPAVAYGTWPYAEYPPSYWGYPDYWGYGVAPGVLARGLWFGAGFAVGRWASGNWGWGGRVNWGNGNIIRNWPRATAYNLTNINNVGNRIGNTWQHNPAHRQGVRYSNSNVQQRFGNADRGNRGNLAAGAAGLGAGAAAIRGAQRTNAANHQAQRHNAGNRQGQRQNVANRQGQRHNAGNHVANRSSANRASSQRASTANRASAQRQSASHSAAHRAARQTPSRGAASRSGGRLYASAAGGRGMGGSRGGGGRGGGRLSDLRLKHDIVQLGQLANGVGVYRFVYNGGHRAYVGVIAQEVQQVMPAAVTRGADGYLRVRYDKLGLRFQTYREWMHSSGRESLLLRLHTGLAPL
jgi:hypothetical protein